MKLGIVGLPNVGKSTLFNAITNIKAECANYPFCTIEPNVGLVNVPDERLANLANLYNCTQIVPAVIEFVDIAGLVKGASNGDGLGNKFLSHIREVDAIVHVVRCFDDEDIVHTNGKVNPVYDIETINLELILSDIEQINRRLTKSKLDKAEHTMLCDIKNALEESHELDEKAKEFAKSLGLLSVKPVIYAANTSDAAQNKYVEEVRRHAAKSNAHVFIISAKLELELSELTDNELVELGLERSGLNRLISCGYELLNQISFLTAGPKETRAWTITRGAKAPQAAGRIHSDFERGFIKAEVISYDELIRVGSFVNAKANGLVRIEGKDYVVQDGDVILFRFNV